MAMLQLPHVVERKMGDFRELLRAIMLASYFFYFLKCIEEWFFRIIKGFKNILTFVSFKRIV